jgi:hypothetical protein
MGVETVKGAAGRDCLRGYAEVRPSVGAIPMNRQLPGRAASSERAKRPRWSWKRKLAICGVALLAATLLAACLVSRYDDELALWAAARGRHGALRSLLWWNPALANASANDEFAQRFAGFQLSEIVETPLLAATSRGDLAAMRLLLDAGADPNRRGAFSGTPLARAAWRGELDAARLLLDRGATYGDSAVVAAIGNRDMAMLALVAPAGVADRDPALARQLSWTFTARVGQSWSVPGTSLALEPAIVSVLLDAGASLKGDAPRFLLARAVDEGGTDVERMLLERGVSLSILLESGTVFEAASGRASTMKMFSMGADPLVAPPKGLPAIVQAVMFNQEETALALLELGADPNARDAGSLAYTSDSVLLLAAQRKRPKLVQALLEAGADVASLNFADGTPRPLKTSPEVRAMLDEAIARGAASKLEVEEPAKPSP